MREFLKKWTDVNYEQEPQLVQGPATLRKAHTEGRAQLFADMLKSWASPDGSAYPFYDWMQGIKYWPDVLPNVWLGISVEDQKGRTRIPLLLYTQPPCISCPASRCWGRSI